MDQLASAAHFFQDKLAFFSSGHIETSWLIAAFFVVVVILIFTLDKSKTILIFLIAYTVGFAVMQFPSAMAWIDKRLTADELRYAKIGIGILPIIALLVLKFKRKR